MISNVGILVKSFILLVTSSDERFKMGCCFSDQNSETHEVLTYFELVMSHVLVQIIWIVINNKTNPGPGAGGWIFPLQWVGGGWR